MIVPDSSRYREEGVAGEWMAPPDPLDELAFLYYLRSAPLEVGQSYTLERYFKTGYNPIQVTVTARRCCRSWAAPTPPAQCRSPPGVHHAGLVYRRQAAASRSGRAAAAVRERDAHAGKRVRRWAGKTGLTA